MAINDEIREQTKKLSDMTFRKKISYIIYYYKVHILVAIFIIILLTSLIHTIVSHKESLFSCVMINSLPYDSSFTTLKEDFSSYAGIDLDEYDVNIDCTMNMNYTETDQMTYGYAQKILALLNAGDVDVFIADQPVIDNYAQISAFADLEKALPDDLKQQLSGKFDYYYYEYTDEDTNETSLIPIGLYIYDSNILKNCYDRDGVHGMYAEKTNPIFCITSTGKNSENAIRFLQYLVSEN